MQDQHGELSQDAQSSENLLIDLCNPNNFGEGYIILSRSSLSSEVFQDKDPLYWKAWTWMLMKANHSRVERNEFVYERGEFYTCLEEINSSLCFYRRRKLIKPSLKKIRKMLDWFVRQRMVEKRPVDRSEKLTIDSHTTHKKGSRGAYIGLRIRIVNYDSYQNQFNYRGRHRGTGGAEVGHDNKNGKNENNEFEEIVCDSIKAKEPKKKLAPSPDVRAFMGRWNELFQHKFNHPYVFTEEKECNLISGLLERFPLEELLRLAERFFSEGDPWVDEVAGHTIPVFNSLIPKLVSKKRKVRVGSEEYYSGLEKWK